MKFTPGQTEGPVKIPLANFHLDGELSVPSNSSGVVLFAHGSGSSRFSPRNQLVAGVLRQHRLGTLLFDLLTGAEEQDDRNTGHLRFDIGRLSQRLLAAAAWFHAAYPQCPLGFFGSSTGAAAALVAAAQSPVRIQAVVSRGGRPDLAGAILPKVTSPTLLLVGGEDTTVLSLNREALARMCCPKELRIIARASHLFEEPGTLEQVARLAAEWFERHFEPAPHCA